MSTMRMVLARTLAGAALMALSATAQAQSVTPAQQDAIRSNCRSDFLANCSGVPRGGREAFMCLEQNKAKLSGGCKSAVDAVAAASAPKPAAAPPVEAKPQPAPALAATPAPAAAAPAATEKPAPVATAPAAPSTAKPAAKPVQAPKAAAAPVRPVAPPPAAASTVPAAVSPTAAAPDAAKRQPTLGEAVMIRRFCANDYRVLCKSTQIGGGRAIKCLADNGPALSPGCKAAMAKAGN